MSEDKSRWLISPFADISRHLCKIMGLPVWYSVLLMCVDNKHNWSDEHAQILTVPLDHAHQKNSRAGFAVLGSQTRILAAQLQSARCMRREDEVKNCFRESYRPLKNACKANGVEIHGSVLM